MGEDTQDQQMEKMHTFSLKRVPSVDSRQVESYAEFLNNRDTNAANPNNTKAWYVKQSFAGNLYWTQ